MPTTKKDVSIRVLLDQSKFRERFDEIKAILGLTDVDCKKIFTVNRLENKEGRNSDRPKLDFVNKTAMLENFTKKRLTKKMKACDKKRAKGWAVFENIALYLQQDSIEP